MLFAALGYWGIGLPLGAILAFKAQMGGIGIWIGLATGLAIVAALMLTRWMQRERLGLVGKARNLKTAALPAIFVRLKGKRPPDLAVFIGGADIQPAQ